jgi:hypothetical protein
LAVDALLSGAASRVALHPVHDEAAGHEEPIAEAVDEHLAVGDGRRSELGVLADRVSGVDVAVPQFPNPLVAETFAGFSMVSTSWSPVREVSLCCVSTLGLGMKSSRRDWIV